jgi:hypothetical protein
MVKLQDGSNVFAAELLLGNGEDDEGKPLKFEMVKSATPDAVPTWSAKSQMKDGSERTRFYSFSLADTQVKVLVITKTKEELKAEAAAAETAAKEAEKEKERQQPKPKIEKAFKTVSPASTSKAATKGRR